LVIQIKFNKNWRKLGGGLSAVVMAVMMESMLMPRLVKLTTKLLEPIQATDVLALDLWASRTSILFLVLEIISLRHFCSTIQAFVEVGMLKCWWSKPRYLGSRLCWLQSYLVANVQLWSFQSSWWIRTWIRCSNGQIPWWYLRFE
jgi:hypothetical protein